LVTHSQELAQRADRIILLRDGVLEQDAGFDVASREWAAGMKVQDEL